MKKWYLDWLKGYDLVVEEDNGEVIFFYVKIFLWLDFLEKERKVELFLYLYDGESDWVLVVNLYDVILFGICCIGYGFNFFCFLNLIELVKCNNVCIEVNLLSN